MGQALYRKYRSKSLDEIVGQAHITHTLREALKQGRISHAYLFTGPRGTGKTSIARIWAHAINDTPYSGEPHLDIIEIDAASNRRIDEIRDLRDKVHVAPTSLRYKVYIIDEVHMLTREAFNALLKTLEEPPEHAVFILATTDVHKLPETIISRTQRFNFKPGERQQVVAHLRRLADQEKITISDEALSLLAEAGEGSFRDSVSLLDQAGSQGKPLELADVQQLLGIPPATAVSELLSATLNSQQRVAEVMSALNALYEQGFQAAAIAKQLAQLLRNDLIDEHQYESTYALALLERLLEVPAAHQPERFLEVTLLTARPPHVELVGASVEPKPQPKAPEPPQVSDPTPKETPSEPVAQKPEPSKTVTAAKPNKALAFDDSLWPEVLQALKQRHNTVYGIVRMAQPRFADNELTLAFAFPFHQKRINEANSRQLLGDIINELTGQAIQIECIVDKTATPPQPVVPSANSEKVTAAAKPAEKPAPKQDLSTINNIFGSAELLES